jgi:hypothetical protein
MGWRSKDILDSVLKLDDSHYSIPEVDFRQCGACCSERTLDNNLIHHTPKRGIPTMDEKSPAQCSSGSTPVR